MPAYVLIAVLVVLLTVSLPVWPHSRTWGYSGAGGIGGILLIVALLLFFRVL